MNSFGARNIADSLFQTEDYFRASIEYERLIFYSTDRSVTNNNLYKKALCFINLEDYTKALEELQAIYFNSVEDTLYAKVTYQQAFCYYLNDKALNAIWKIEEFMNRTNDTISFNNFMPLMILCHNELNEWDKAHEKLSFYIVQNVADTVFQHQLLFKVDSLYANKRIPKMRKTKTAENLSRFIPGAGQMYAGKVGEGAVNFLINASILTFAVHQLYYQFYVTGYLGGLGLLNKTYHGGIKRAAILTTQRNFNIMNEFNQKVNAVMISSLN